MNICVIGTGNIGTALIAELSRNNNVKAYTSKPYSFGKTIHSVDESENSSMESGTFEVFSDYEEALKGAELVFIALPTFLLKQTVIKIEPFLDSDVMVGFVPGAGGVEFAAHSLIERGITVFGFERVPYIARIVEYGKVVSASKKKKLRIAAIPKERSVEVAECIGNILSVECGVIEDFLSITLTPTLHIARLYELYGNRTYMEYEVDKSPFFYSEWTDEASYICFALDEELHNITAKLTEHGVFSRDLVPYSVHYESKTPKQLTKKLKSISSLEKLKGPIVCKNGKLEIDIESRYFTESFPYRLQLMKSFAEIVKIETPMTDEILNWYKEFAFGNNADNVEKECYDPQSCGIDSIKKLKSLYGTDDVVIGVLGGMGTFATINFFDMYAKVFEAEKEWKRPRIIIDNNCVMPSRVRAILYHENVLQLVDAMYDSLKNLIHAGANRLVLACNTSHYFLPMVYEKDESIKEYVIDLIDATVEFICEQKIKEVFLLASEGTIESGIYHKRLKNADIKCNVPRCEDYIKLRDCIEAVKQNKYDEDVKNKFVELMNNGKVCILGCTELPILYDRYQTYIDSTTMAIDPLKIVLLKLKKEIDNE